MKLLYKEIHEEDFPALAPVMKRAFDDDAQKHLGVDEGGPPGYDNGDFFRTWLLPYQESVGFKIMAGDRIIGGIIVWILPNGHNILGTIFVDPEFQDQGIGQKSWQYIERSFPDTLSWRLGTPTWAEKNHFFYQKCGFVEVDEDPLIPFEEDVTIYRKDLLP
jgi:GNAT superfamily N-acetyltransferase